MSRGIFILIIQLAVSVGTMSIGGWAIAQPRHLQGFIHENFALLPPARPRSFVAPALIRAVGIGLILYGCMLASNYKDEIVWLGKIFRV